jgi:hypothetical protein
VRRSFEDERAADRAEAVCAGIVLFNDGTPKTFVQENSLSVRMLAPSNARGIAIDHYGTWKQGPAAGPLTVQIASKSGAFLSLSVRTGRNQLTRCVST